MLLSGDGITDVSNHWNSAVRSPREGSGCVLWPPCLGGFPTESCPLRGGIVWRTKLSHSLCSYLSGLRASYCCLLLPFQWTVLSQLQEFCHCQRKTAGSQEMGFYSLWVPGTDRWRYLHDLLVMFPWKHEAVWTSNISINQHCSTDKLPLF